MTTQTGIEPKKSVKPDVTCDVTPSSDSLLMKDLPRPEHEGSGAGTVAPFGTGPLTEATYNTVDLGDPGTSLDVLRPVELDAEMTSTIGTGTHAGNPACTETVPAAAAPAEIKTDAARERDTPQGIALRDPLRTVPDTPPSSQATPTVAPKRNPNFKATLAGEVFAPAAVTKAAAQRHPDVKPVSRPRSKSRIKILGYLGAILVAVIGIGYLVAEKPAVGTITGVVVDAQSGRVIPSATVELDGKVAVATNGAGLYVFPDVRTGSYVVKASAPGYQPQTGTVQSGAPQSAQLSFALAPLAAATPAPVIPTAPTDTNNAQATTSTTTAPTYGGVDLEVDFEDFLVFVDGEIYGKNAKKLKRLTTGEHRIVLQIDGFQDYAATVTVKARSTSNVKIGKSDLTPKVDPIKRGHGLFTEGKEYLDRSLWQPAIEAFDQALASDPQNADAVRYRGWAYMKAGDTARAAADFSHAAQMYDDSKRLMEAVTCMGYLIDLSPNDPSLWRTRGDYHLGLTEYAKAISDCEHAIKLDKKSLENQMALGEAYFASGDFRRAAKEFDRARKMSGDPIRPYIRLILAYYHAGDNDEVMKRYKDFTKIAPQDLQKKLQADPEWLPVLQIIGPDERQKN